MNKNILDAIKGILYSTEPDGAPALQMGKIHRAGVFHRVL